MAKTIDAYLPDFRIDAMADGKIARRILAPAVGRPGYRYPPNPAGSAYDTVAADAVSRFQTDRHLTVDGTVGPRETAPALGVTL